MVKNEDPVIKTAPDTLKRIILVAQGAFATLTLADGLYPLMSTESLTLAVGAGALCTSVRSAKYLLEPGVEFIANGVCALLPTGAGG